MFGLCVNCLKNICYNITWNLLHYFSSSTHVLFSSFKTIKDWLSQQLKIIKLFSEGSTCDVESKKMQIPCSKQKTKQNSLYWRLNFCIGRFCSQSHMNDDLAPLVTSILLEFLEAHHPDDPWCQKVAKISNFDWNVDADRIEIFHKSLFHALMLPYEV